MQFSTKIDGFEQKDSQGFENSYNSYEQYPLEKFFIFTIYQNYTLALKARKSSSFKWKCYIILYTYNNYLKLVNKVIKIQNAFITWYFAWFFFMITF